MGDGFWEDMKFEVSDVWSLFMSNEEFECKYLFCWYLNLNVNREDKKNIFKVVLYKWI